MSRVLLKYWLPVFLETRLTSSSPSFSYSTVSSDTLLQSWSSLELYKVLQHSRSLPLFSQEFQSHYSYSRWCSLLLLGFSFWSSLFSRKSIITFSFLFYTQYPIDSMKTVVSDLSFRLTRLLLRMQNLDSQTTFKTTVSRQQRQVFQVKALQWITDFVTNFPSVVQSLNSSLTEVEVITVPRIHCTVRCFSNFA